MWGTAAVFHEMKHTLCSSLLRLIHHETPPEMPAAEMSRNAVINLRMRVARGCSEKHTRVSSKSRFVCGQ